MTFAPSAPIVVVSGLPRSGTSMMMRMLEAAGMPLLVDSVRARDEDNPYGYFEFEPVKRLAQDASFLTKARGAAIKVVAPLLRHLPEAYEYRIVFVERALGEVLASQSAMLRRQGLAPDSVADRALARAFESSLESARDWIDGGSNRSACFVSHSDALSSPESTARRVSRFLAESLAPDGFAIEGFADKVERWTSGETRILERMAAAIDPGLHRQRA